MEELDDAAINQVLRRAGYGFLGLARDDQPYVIPMSFGFDGDRLYLQMNSHGRKFDYIGGDPTVTLSVVEVDKETGVSKSVLVEGTLYEVLEDDSGQAFETLADNAEFGTDLAVWGMPLEETDLTLFEIRPAKISGRVFGKQTA